jgi:ferric-dicitrate binding protein FerR (iron transport regulator)
MKKVTSENVQELLTRYMEGESTQEEQKALRQYLSNAEKLPEELRPYARMFSLLEEKPQTPSTEALNRFAEAPQPARRHIPLWPLLAAACLAAFAVIFLTPPKGEENMAIAYVEGKTLNNEAMAMQMGQEALQEIFSNGNEEEQLTDLFNEQ